jgi:hypothetical protein
MLRLLSAASLNNRLASVSLACSAFLSHSAALAWNSSAFDTVRTLHVYVVKWPQGSSLWLSPMGAEGSALVAFGFVQAIM